MEEKILIAYASKCGSTAEVAGVVGQVLNEAGAIVDVRPIRQVRDVSAYRATIVETAIRVGACLPETKAFVEANREALNGMPVAYFCVCLAVKEEKVVRHLVFVCLPGYGLSQHQELVRVIGFVHPVSVIDVGAKALEPDPPESHAAAKLFKQFQQLFLREQSPKCLEIASPGQTKAICPSSQ